MRPSVAAVALLLLVTSCSGSVPRPPYVPQTTAALVPVGFPPPPPRVEVVPKQPADAAVWIDGEWRYNGLKWGWKPGRWVIVPPGVAFSPWTTVWGEDGAMFFAPGVFRNAQGGEVAEPSALAYGTAYSGAVIDAEGEDEQTAPSQRAGPRPPPTNTPTATDGGS